MLNAHIPLRTKSRHPQHIRLLEPVLPDGARRHLSTESNERGAVAEGVLQRRDEIRCAGAGGYEDDAGGGI